MFNFKPLNLKIFKKFGKLFNFKINFFIKNIDALDDFLFIALDICFKNAPADKVICVFLKLFFFKTIKICFFLLFIFIKIKLFGATVAWFNNVGCIFKKNFI